MNRNTYEEFFIRQAADLRAEGVGVNATYFLWGSISVNADGLVNVAMRGWSAAAEIARRHGGSVDWWGVRSL
ncbi:MAG: hypothetical protein JJU06_20975 [Ectothiorhodospiraceae bacterium]|nr:hypothetical protein [Ectothiorhodospiraceae bacterium]MCH8502842.1 hypothetical protein [Ectothiorhodospiraceae bacterium]